MLQDGFPPSHVPACCSLVMPLHLVRYGLLAGASTSICRHGHLQHGAGRLQKASPARHKQLTVITTCGNSAAAGTGSITYASQRSQLLLALLTLHLLIRVQTSVSSYEQAMTASFSQLSPKQVVCLHCRNMRIPWLGWTTAQHSVSQTEGLTILDLTNILMQPCYLGMMLEGVGSLLAAGPLGL